MSCKLSSLFRIERVRLLLFGALLLCLIACSISPVSNNPSVARTPAATAPSAGTPLYQANWSRGLAGWRGVAGWKVAGGYLESQAESSNTLTIPYQPALSRYALEVRFQILRVLGNSASFMIVDQRRAGRDGYYLGWRHGLLGYIDPPGSDARSSTLTSDYDVRDIWHTYRLEVRDNEVQLFDNGVFVGRMHSEQTDMLSSGPLSLNASVVVLRVSQLRLLTL